MTDFDKRMDARLREYGDRWRAALPDPAEPPAARHRARHWAPVAAAAAVALVAGGVALTGIDDETNEPTDTKPAPAVVPWAPLDPHRDELPTVMEPAWPTAEDFAGVPPCEASDLRIGTPQTDGAAGTMYISVPIEAIGGRTCRLDPWPEPVFLSPDGPLDITASQLKMTHGVDGSDLGALVRPDHPVTVTMGWAVSHSCPEVDNTEIEIGVMGAASIAWPLPGFGRTSCSPGEERALPFVRQIEFDGVHPPRTVSPWRDVEVTGDLQAGTVVMESPDDLPLAACPDYRIEIAGSLGPAAFHEWGLNCEAVPHRDADGAPYLPAGTPVTFEMGPPLGAITDSTAVWTLLAPGNHVLKGPLGVAQSGEGLISGQVRVVGGPAPGIDEPVTAGRVIATGTNGGGEASIAPDGTYSMSLPAGEYDLAVEAEDRWKGVPCHDRAGVTGGATTDADIICSIK